MFLQASKQKKTANKSAASTAKDRLTESVLNKQTEVSHRTCHSLPRPHPAALHGDEQTHNLPSRVLVAQNEDRVNDLQSNILLLMLAGCQRPLHPGEGAGAGPVRHHPPGHRQEDRQGLRLQVHRQAQAPVRPPLHLLRSRGCQPQHLLVSRPIRRPANMIHPAQREMDGHLS